MAENP